MFCDRAVVIVHSSVNFQHNFAHFISLLIYSFVVIVDQMMTVILTPYLLCWRKSLMILHTSTTTMMPLTLHTPTTTTMPLTVCHIPLLVATSVTATELKTRPLSTTVVMISMQMTFLMRMRRHWCPCWKQIQIWKVEIQIAATIFTNFTNFRLFGLFLSPSFTFLLHVHLFKIQFLQIWSFYRIIGFFYPKNGKMRT